MLFYIIIIIIKYNYLLPVGRAMNMNLLQSFGVDRSLKCKYNNSCDNVLRFVPTVCYFLENYLCPNLDILWYW